MKQNIYQQRIQEWEKQYGGLSPNAQKKLKKLLEEFEKTQSVSKTNKALSLAIGTKLIREYQGKTIIVIVVQQGFEFKNKIYKSLSAIADEVTGKHWNGRKFFGVV